MSQSFDIAVIGATGTVGETIVQILEERDFPVAGLYLLASAESAGSSVPYRGKNLRVREVDSFDFSQVRLAFFAASPAVTRSYCERASAAGCAVIDLSAGLPAEQAPNVVPEVNAERLRELPGSQLLACPGSVAIALAMVLAPLKPLLDIQRVSVTACLPVSSQGREGVSELARQTAELLNARPLEPRIFDRQMAFNVLAQVGTPDTDGHVPAEKRLVAELRELLSLPLIKVAVACIQVPVFFGDSLSVSVQTSEPVDLAGVTAALDAAQGVERVEGDYPTPVGDAVGQDDVYVGRLRQGVDDPCELNFWVTSDNVRKGAALNAVQLAELLIKDVT